MVVVRSGTRTPLRQLVATSLRKFSVGKNGPRKNLFGVTKNDAAVNLKHASSLLDTSVVTFTNRWNFDPITETPLPQGRYSWTPLLFKKGALDLAEAATGTEMNFKSSTLPKASESIEPKLPCEEIDCFPFDDMRSIELPSCASLSPLINNMNLNTATPRISPHEDAKNSDITKSLQAEANAFQGIPTSQDTPKDTKKFRQTKITDYGKIVKRKHRKSSAKSRLML